MFSASESQTPNPVGLDELHQLCQALKACSGRTAAIEWEWPHLEACGYFVLFRRRPFVYFEETRS
jgi:hypothetical protein